MNKYSELRNRQEKEMNALPMHFAFNSAQFKEALAEMNLTTENCKDKLVRGIAGSFYLKTDSKVIHDTFERFHTEKSQAIENDKTGTGYMLDMFTYELANHEFCVTYDLTDTLDSLGISIEEVNKNPLMLSALREAKAIVLSYDN